MPSIDLDALAEARAFEETRIVGYKIILSFPEEVLKELNIPGKAETREALAWSENRLAKINGAFAGIDPLLADGYPDRVQQIAPEAVIEQLQASLDILQLAIAEFQPPPSGTLTVGPEIAV